MNNPFTQAWAIIQALPFGLLFYGIILSWLALYGLVSLIQDVRGL